MFQPPVIKIRVKLTPQEALAESEIYFRERKWKVAKRYENGIKFMFTASTREEVAKDFGWFVAEFLTLGFAEIFAPSKSRIPILKVTAMPQGSETELCVQFFKRDEKLVSMESLATALGGNKNIGASKDFEVHDKTSISGKKWQIALALSIFLGIFGFDRFYLGRIGTGILKLLTYGGLGIWWVADIVKIANGKMTDSQGKLLAKN